MPNELITPQAWMVQRVLDPLEGPLIKEGEPDMSYWPDKTPTGEAFPSMQDLRREGDARSSVSYSLSLKDFGNGGEVHVSLSLAHGQDPWSVYYAQKGAAELVKATTFELLNDMETRLVARGILKPRS